MVKMRRFRGAVGLLAIVVLFAAPAGLVQAALVWQSETVDADGIVGWDTSLALDSDGHPHISYYDFTNGALKYATFDGSGWQIHAVDEMGNVGWNTSLALDSAGHPHISYTDGSNADLKYAHFDGTTWQIEAVDTEGSVGSYTSMALDANGHPHISYHDASHTNLKYAHLDGTEWQIEVVDDGQYVGRETSLALDSAGHPHISYYDVFHSDLKYAHFDGTTWQIEAVDTEGVVGISTSLAMDADDQPHISYFNRNSWDLKYAHFDGTTWQIETIDATGDTGLDTSLAIDSQGQPHIGYWHVGNEDLKYAAFDGTDWQIKLVDGSETSVGRYPSLALDSADQPYISYYDRSNTDLKYAQLVVNEPPSANAGGPYTGAESSPISLNATVTDPEGDQVTTTWSYTINTADTGTTCAFGDQNQIDTTFSCTDDGAFTITLTANDGANPPVTASATVTISNVAPTVTLSDDVTMNEGDSFFGAGRFGTSSSNDSVTTTVDYDDGAGPQALAVNPDGTFTLSHTYLQDGVYTVEVCISDDDQGSNCDDLQVTVLNVAPAVTLGADVVINEGDSYADGGGFSDPGINDVHTATVDYGDEAGAQSLLLNADDTFALNHAYLADDGQYTVEVCVTDANDAQSAGCDELRVTVVNVKPKIMAIDVTVAGNRANVTVTATDPAGVNDPLSYSFDCNNDGDYEVGPQSEHTTTCAFGNQEGSFVINVGVDDGDGGVTADSAGITIVTALCSNNYTGVLRYSDSCRDHETAVTIPGESPVTVCASRHNGLLRLPRTGSCAGHETSYVLPEDGPMSVCVNTYTQTMRVVGNVGQCSSNESGRVIGATEIGELPPPRRR